MVMRKVLWHRMERGYRLAVQIAKQENADMLIVQLAALLHDVDDVKISPETHAAKKNAVDFMESNGVDNKIIEDVCNIIEEVSFAGTDSVVPSTLVGRCVQDGCNGSDWNRNEDIGLIENPEWKRGLQMEEKLHTELLRFT